MDKQKINVLIAAKAWSPEPWQLGLSKKSVFDNVYIWPDVPDLSEIDALFVWKPLDEGVIAKMPNLKWISSMGAGVDHLMRDDQIPDHIPITRIVDPWLTRDMTNYVIMAVLMHQRSMNIHAQNQKSKIWDRLPYHSLCIGVLGLGELGGHLAQHLSALGFEVCGISRTRKDIKGVNSYLDSEMDDFLTKPDVLVNLLPVTAKTENLLDANFFSKVKTGAYLINVARGNHVVDEDLLKALDSGKLCGALLDVFREEPLQKHHAFWTHPKIKMTPHVASVTSPESAMNLLEKNAQRLVQGRELLHQVDMERGY